MKIEFSPGARAEFDDGIDWYARQSIPAAIGFATEVDTAINTILADPNRCAHTYAGCQLLRLKHYPYCVVYKQTDKLIVVVAIAHAKRRPGYWRNR